MALIECKNCGKQVSDMAVRCPHCGVQLTETENEEIKNLFCIDCGTKIPEGAEECPNCGRPIPKIGNETESANSGKKNSNTVKKIIIAAIIVIAVIVLGIVIFNNKKKADAEAASKQYIENVEEVSELMLFGAAKAESAGNLIKKVWYNTIYEEKDPESDKYTRKNNGSGEFYDDFNDSLDNLFYDEDFISRTSEIIANQSDVENIMKELKNPPEEHEEAYEVIKDLYDVYMDLTNCATSPSGSLNTYSETFNEADQDFMTAYNKIGMYLE